MTGFATQSIDPKKAGLLRRFAPRNDESNFQHSGLIDADASVIIEL
jgi:hypothetical protein